MAPQYPNYPGMPQGGGTTNFAAPTAADKFNNQFQRSLRDRGIYTGQGGANGMPAWAGDRNITNLNPVTGKVESVKANPYYGANHPTDMARQRAEFEASKNPNSKGKVNELSAQTRGAQIWNPFSQVDQSMQNYDYWMSRPENAGLQANANQMYNQAGQVAGQYGQGLDGMMKRQAMGMTPMQKQLMAQAQGKNSVVGAQAQVQRNQAMGDIAQQASMQQGAQYNPAIARQALMSQAGVGQNMAAQVAADKMRERMAAQEAYMNSRMQGQQGYLGMQQQRIGNAGNMAEMAQGRLGAAQGTYGSNMNIAQDAYGGMATAASQIEGIGKNVKVK